MIKLENFGIADKDVLGDPRIPVGPKALYALLCCFKNNNDECFPANAQLANHLGCKVRTITRYFEELEQWGILTRTPTGHNKPYITKILHGVKIKKYPQWSPTEGRQLSLSNKI